MTIRTTPANLLDTPAIPVQARLAAAWTSFMFLYVYVDILNFYKPGVVDGIRNGRIWTFNAAGATWEWAGFYGISIGVEVLLLAFILRSAWVWPRTGAAHLATARTGPGRQVSVPDLP